MGRSDPLGTKNLGDWGAIGEKLVAQRLFLVLFWSFCWVFLQFVSGVDLREVVGGLLG